MYPFHHIGMGWIPFYIDVIERRALTISVSHHLSFRISSPMSPDTLLTAYGRHLNTERWVEVQSHVRNQRVFESCCFGWLRSCGHGVLFSFVWSAKLVKTVKPPLISSWSTPEMARVTKLVDAGRSSPRVYFFVRPPAAGQQLLLCRSYFTDS